MAPVEAPAKPKTAQPGEKPEEKKFATRDDWLAASGKLREEEFEVEGIGLLLLSEISGTARAQIVSAQSAGLLADAKKIDAVAYQRSLLLNGVVDPSSPPGGRLPLFQAGDIDRVMKIGGRAIAKVIDKIEELSALGAYQASAEGNSGTTPNGAGTSG